MPASDINLIDGGIFVHQQTEWENTRKVSLLAVQFSQLEYKSRLDLTPQLYITPPDVKSCFLGNNFIVKIWSR